MLDDFEPLTDAQVQAGARPGESWEAARCRLEEARQEGEDTGGIIVSDRSPYASLTIRPEQLDAVKAYQQLSSREQFERWGFCPETLAAIARPRLEAASRAGLALVDEHPGADYTLAGPVDECEGLDGQPIQWEPGELGSPHYE